MSHAERVLQATAIRLLLIQASITLVTALGYGVTAGYMMAIAALAGGLIALFNTGVSTFFLRRATAVAGSDQQQGLLLFYTGAALRFLAVPLFVAVGIALLNLNPIALLIGFGLAQLAYLFNKVKT